MPNWVSFNNWMKFQHLDINQGLTSSFTIGYRFTDDSADHWTNRFNRFKAKNEKAIRGGVNVMRVAVPLLVQQLKVDASKTVFIPALSSHETIASNETPLSIMTRICAKASKARFKLDAITKEKNTPLHRIGNRDDRQRALYESDYRSGKIEADSVFILDDFITTGGTMSHIAQAIHKVNDRVSVYGIALAKAEKREYNKEVLGSEISNNHISSRWETLWQKGEVQ